jgi:hypothetical protein
VVVALGMVVCCLVFVAGASALGDVTSGGAACPNEASAGFRSYLPDCRGYEQVTPVFKEGTELELHALSPDGSDAIALTLGGFARIEQDSTTEGGTYQLARSASGWTVTAISPASASFPNQEWLAACPELSSTLWVARAPSESIAAENLYVREADGTVVKIGPMLPPAAVIGPPSNEFQGFLYGGEIRYRDASADLSHVLFTILKGGRFDVSWPGDATNGQSSLYEYVGTGQTRPELVGVNNEGHLISTCATWLGSNASQDVYNAVSTDGSRVFFTAQAPTGECPGTSGPVVNEVFARIDGSETVGISEPSDGADGACAACNESEPHSAEFAGASEDGSKVFFLTEQELLPGVAGGMGLYEYDFDSPVGHRVLRVAAGALGAAEVQGVARVSEDGSHVYFVARGRLSEGPRGGQNGSCLTELSVGEQAQEAIAGEEEAKAEPVTTGAKCRPLVGGDNLYVFERDTAHPAGKVSFIATLCTGTEESGALGGIAQCPSARNDESDWSVSDQRRVQATPDGRFLVFSSAGELTSGDASRVNQIFEYDTVTGELVRVSQPRAGYTPKEAKLSAEANASEIPVPAYSGVTGPTVPATGLAVSGDGSVVVFSSAGALTKEAEAAAGAGVESAYEYRSSVASGGTISTGGVYLISGESTAPSRGVEGMDGSGDDVFFVTAGSLVPQDTDSQFDTYDARVGGGFLGPDPPAGCIAEACVSPALVPSLVAPGSDVPGGAGVPAASVVGPSGSVPAVGGKVPGRVVLTRRERLARALRACTRVRKKDRRVACEETALKRYSAHRKPKSTGLGSK